MNTRRFGRLGWHVSEIGHGMWGMGGQWGGTDDAQARDALDAAVEHGCNIFDTAQHYGDGHSERLLGELIRRTGDRRLYTATKIPPKNGQMPARSGTRIEDVFPPAYIRESVHRSLSNLGLDRVDLMQFHVWQDTWAADEGWQRTVTQLTREGLVAAWGICANRWEPANCVRTLRTGLVDALQVTYNIFEQAPEDVALPACREHGVAVIARVPFDEGSLTGILTRDSTWADGDWRNGYFTPNTLAASVAKADALRPLVPPGWTMPQLALRFVLAHRDVSTVIPGMRTRRHVAENMAASSRAPLPCDLRAKLSAHRWDRTPAERRPAPRP